MNGAECKAWINWYDFMVVYISEGYHYRRCDFVAQKDHFVVFNFRHGIRVGQMIQQFVVGMRRQWGFCSQHVNAGGAQVVPSLVMSGV